MQIFDIIAPLAIICLLGYLCARFKFLSTEQLDGVTKFTFNIPIPAFLFYKMLSADLSGSLNIEYFLSFYIPLLLIYAFACLVNYLFHSDFKNNLAASATFALGASYSNTVIVALPILLAAIGEQVISLIFLLITFHSALLFTLTSLLAINKKTSASGKQGIDWQKLGKQTINNPIIISILSGLLGNIIGLKLPNIVNESLIMISAPAITLALFLLGSSLNKYQISTQKNFITIASFIKLALFPLLVFIFARYIFNLDNLVTTVVVIMSASPTGVNAYLIAKIQGVHQDTVAGLVVASTLLSIITIPVWLLILQS